MRKQTKTVLEDSSEIPCFPLPHGLSHLPASTELEESSRLPLVPRTPNAKFLASAVPTGLEGVLPSGFPEHGLKGGPFDYPGNGKTHKSKHIFSVDLASVLYWSVVWVFVPPMMIKSKDLTTVRV